MTAHLKPGGHDLSRKKAEQKPAGTEKTLTSALREAEEREAEILAMLNVSRKILENHDFDTTARSIFDSCKTLIGAGAGYIALLSEDGTHNEVLFLDSGGMPCSVDPDLPMPVRGLRAEACLTGKTVYHNDFSNSEWTAYMPEGHVRLENVLFAPLVIRGKTVALLGLANKPKGFNQTDRRTATAFGELAAIALHNSRTMEMLEKSEARFRSLAETAKDAIISIDAGGNIIYWNRGAEAIFGYSGKEISGNSLKIIIPESLRPIHEEGLHNAVTTEKNRIIGKTVEIAGLRKDGTQFPMELSLARGSTKEGIFFTAIIRDISERKETEKELLHHRERLMELVAERTTDLQALNEKLEKEIAERIKAEKDVRESEENYRNLYDNAPDMYFSVNSKQRIITCNDTGSDMLGYRKEEIIGKDLACFLTEDSGRVMKKEFPRLLHDKVLNNLQMTFIRKNSSTFPAILNVYAKFDGDGRFMLSRAIARDVTELKKAEAETMRASHLAALGELAAGVAHEINNPINGIINYTQILANKSRPGSREHDITGRIIREGDRIANIVKNLLSFASENREQKHTVHVRAILSDALALAETQIKKDSITLNVRLPEDLPDIIAQPEQIEQVFLNLISNARYALNQKFQGEQRGKTLDITAEKFVHDNMHYVRIVFHDSGSGIPDDIIGNVLNPFFTTKPGGIGTGLGLSISHGIISDHGGRMTIESVIGEYTKVIIDLPVK